MWVAATGAPGLSLESTLEDIKVRSDFLRRVHYCQDIHETGGFDHERQAFAVAWADRTLDESETQNTVNAILRGLKAPLHWWSDRKRAAEARAVAAENAKREEERRIRELLRAQVCVCVCICVCEWILSFECYAYVHTC